MVDADEETALLPTARDAAGREEPWRRRVVAFVLVLVGALALIAAAGRGAADSETHKAVLIYGGGKFIYGAVEADGEGGEPHQVAPLNGPPAPTYYHKGPPKDESSPDDPDDSHHDDDEDDGKPCDEEVGNGVGGGSGHSLSSKCVAMEADVAVQPYVYEPSDLRMKQEVAKLGQSPSGIPIYRFKYKEAFDPDGSGATYVGTMAQDLLETYPAAVITDKDGFYRVNYEQIDVDMMRLA